MDDTPIIKGRPPNNEEEFIKEKYLESISKQPELMDNIAKQIITLELAIPGLYASALKLGSGKHSTVSLSSDIYCAFAYWLIALICIVVALIPRRYKINIDDHTAIRDSFFKTARYKLAWIVASITTFAAGLFFILKDLIS